METIAQAIERIVTYDKGYDRRVDLGKFTDFDNVVAFRNRVLAGMDAKDGKLSSNEIQLARLHAGYHL